MAPAAVVIALLTCLNGREDGGAPLINFGAEISRRNNTGGINADEPFSILGP